MMETLYDISSGDLHELWDEADMDSTNLALKFASDSDMHDGWLIERDAKMPQVILNDKLMTDALLTGGQPIKTEHSYSLKSDGDSMPDSPCSLQDDDRMDDDMDDDCYPSVVLVAPTFRKQTTKSTSHSVNPLHHCNSSNTFEYNPQQSQQHIQSHLLNQIHAPSSQQSTNNVPSHPVLLVTNNNRSKPIVSHQHTTHHATTVSLNNQNVHLNHPHQHLKDSSSLRTMSINRNGTHNQSTLVNNNRCADILVEDLDIKNEPISPGSSCPGSPTSSFDGDDQADEEDDDADLIAFSTAGELVFEQKNGSQQLSTSPCRFKEKNLSASSAYKPEASPTHFAISNIKIKSESQQSSAFGLPPTPPSSMSSDDSEDNQSSAAGQQETSATPQLLCKSGRRASSVHSNSSTPSTSSTRIAGCGYIGTSSRQPIHTALISNQPKGSTGSLLLTEEEKRTLLAEGYPIPIRLPLTKAEEKSLKKIRRKIKNKISAQESRRKKKEYMDQLERKVEILVGERNNFQQTAITFQKRAEALEMASVLTTKRVETLEATNATLKAQLAKFQTLVKTLNKIKQ